jgi:hypothetical protein
LDLRVLQPPLRAVSSMQAINMDTGAKALDEDVIALVDVYQGVGLGRSVGR